MTDFVSHKFRRVARHIKTFRPLLEETAGGTFGAVMVDHRVAQQTIKPGDGTFLIAKRRSLLDPLNKSRLQDVFSACTRIDAFFNKPKEIGTAREQAF